MKKQRPFMLNAYIENAPGGGGVAHIPILPGLSFRFPRRDEVLLQAIREGSAYVRWLRGRGILETLGIAGHEPSPDWPELCRAVIVEEVDGRTPWISGNPSALFQCDIYGPMDDRIQRHFLLARSAMEEILSRLAFIPEEEWDRPMGEGKRTPRAMLTHLGNVVWWLCSRIDDDLPEPAGDDAETTADPQGRLLRLLDWAQAWALGLSAEQREEFQRPTRYLTSDPEEIWTLSKIIRRQAEHAVEHLRAIGGGPA
jgi:hypothetical protein